MEMYYARKYFSPFTPLFIPLLIPAVLGKISENGVKSLCPFIGSRLSVGEEF